MQPKMIGISGVSGAGKSSLVTALAEKLSANALYWDEFDSISIAPDDYIDWDDRGSDYTEFNYDILAELLKNLKSGKSVTHPIHHTQIQPTNYIIVDAPLGKAHEQTATYIDVFIHLNTPLDIALARRLIRDIDALSLSSKAVKQNLMDYLTRTRKLFSDEINAITANKADLVVDGVKTLATQVDAVIRFLQKQKLAINNAHFDIVDKVDEATEKVMQKDLTATEQAHGIDLNYKPFAIMLRVENNVIGVLQAYTAFSEIYVDLLWVETTYRHQGYGQALLKYLEDQFKGKGFNNINLVTSEFSAPDFYEKCGYKAEFKRYNETNPQLNKTFYVKFFGETIQNQGIFSKKYS